MQLRNLEKIIINGQRDIEDVDEFVYLGAKVCKERGGVKDFEEQVIESQRCPKQTKEDLDI